VDPHSQPQERRRPHGHRELTRPTWKPAKEETKNEDHQALEQDEDVVQQAKLDGTLHSPLFNMAWDLMSIGSFVRIAY